MTSASIATTSRMTSFSETIVYSNVSAVDFLTVEVVNSGSGGFFGVEGYEAVASGSVEFVVPDED